MFVPTLVWLNTHAPLSLGGVYSGCDMRSIVDLFAH